MRHSTGRNLVYRVAAGRLWFLKLRRDGTADPMAREQLGADLTRRALAGNAFYYQAVATCVEVPSAYMLSLAIPGPALNAVLPRALWHPLPGGAHRMVDAFRQLGAIMAPIHAIVLPAPRPQPATTRPFATVGQLLDKPRTAAPLADRIRTWHTARGPADDGDTFVHGNLRLDNVLRVDRTLALIDFENCGTGSPYQDLSRPVSELLLTRCLPIPPEHASTDASPRSCSRTALCAGSTGPNSGSSCARESSATTSSGAALRSSQAQWPACRWCGRSSTTSAASSSMRS